MTVEIGRLETADALRFANLKASDWANALQRGLYPDAPRTVPGEPRRFDVADLVAAWVLGWLFERRVLPKFACEIACGVLRAIRAAPGLQVVSAWKCIDVNGAPCVEVSAAKPRHDAIELFKFQVGKIRREAVAGIRRKMRAGD